jgi:hypothetical protein
LEASKIIFPIFLSPGIKMDFKPSLFHFCFYRQFNFSSLLPISHVPVFHDRTNAFLYPWPNRLYKSKILEQVETRKIVLLFDLYEPICNTWVYKILKRQATFCLGKSQESVKLKD